MDNRSSTGALMGQSRYKVLEPPEVSAEKPDKSKQDQVKKEVSAQAALAALTTNQGWMLIEEKMRKRIEAFKSGSYLVEPVAQNLDATALGELLKVEMKVAAQLESFISEVHVAFENVELEKKERRNVTAASRRPRA